MSCGQKDCLCVCAAAADVSHGRNQCVYISEQERQRGEKRRCDFSAPSGRGLSAKPTGGEKSLRCLSLRHGFTVTPPSQREALEFRACGRGDTDCHGRDAPRSKYPWGAPSQ